MNILFLSQRVPYPPNKGDKLRSFNEIKHLSQSHQISLVCLSDNTEDEKHRTTLLNYCASVDIVFNPLSASRLRSIMALFSSHPLTLAHFFSSELKTIVNKMLSEQSFDLVFVYCSSMAQYVEHVSHIPVVVDFVDVDSEKWFQYSQYARFPMNYIYRLESRRLRSYEKNIIDLFQHGFLVSEKETADFKSLVADSNNLSPLLNGVDTELFRPSGHPYDTNVLVFTGAMDYFANVEAIMYFTRDIMPLIKKTIPGVRLFVVGSNPTKELLEITKDDESIIVTGYVDQVQPYVHKAAVLVAPMRIARGVQNKVLEGMAMGVPVVTTSLGFEGITATPGQDLFVVDDSVLFAEQVIELMQNPQLRNRTAVNARRAVEKNYSWTANLHKLDKIISSLITS